MICTYIRENDGRKSARESASDRGLFREMGEVTKVKRKMSSQVDTGTGEAWLIALLFFARDANQEAMHLKTCSWYATP